MWTSAPLFRHACRRARRGARDGHVSAGRAVAVAPMAARAGVALYGRAGLCGYRAGVAASGW